MEHEQSATAPGNFFDLAATDSGGVECAFSAFRGNVVLVVNVASQCGFTPQYRGLQELYDSYKAQDFIILGFPCNQFGNQEPGTETEIVTFCQRNFGVDFPLFAKVAVNGADAHPVFEFLKSAAPGLLGTTAIKWNFTKFLVGRDGKVLGRFAPTTTPEALRSEIETALNRTA